MDMADFVNKIYEESKLEEPRSILDDIIAHSEGVYPRTRELHQMLDCYPIEYEYDITMECAETMWKVGDTVNVFIEQPYTGRTAFMVGDITPQWAITLSME